PDLAGVDAEGGAGQREGPATGAACRATGAAAAAAGAATTTSATAATRAAAGPGAAAAPGRRAGPVGQRQRRRPTRREGHVGDPLAGVVLGVGATGPGHRDRRGAGGAHGD